MSIPPVISSDTFSRSFKDYNDENGIDYREIKGIDERFLLLNLMITAKDARIFICQATSSDPRTKKKFQQTIGFSPLTILTIQRASAAKNEYQHINMVSPSNINNYCQSCLSTSGSLSLFMLYPLNNQRDLCSTKTIILIRKKLPNFP